MRECRGHSSVSQTITEIHRFSPPSNYLLKIKSFRLLIVLTATGMWDQETWSTKPQKELNIWCQKVVVLFSNIFSQNVDSSYWLHEYIRKWMVKLAFIWFTLIESVRNIENASSSVTKVKLLGVTLQVFAFFSWLLTYILRHIIYP